MANIRTQKRAYKPPKLANVDWNSFRRGLNNLLLDTELQPEEVKDMTNLRLAGKGIVEPRPGTGNYYAAGPSYVRGLKGIYFQGTGTNELLALTDTGYLTKKSGGSYSVITGASYSSGYNAEITQLADLVFISHYPDALSKYNGSNILKYTNLDAPAGLTITKSSGASGAFTRSYRVSAESNVGETLASTAISLGTLPENFSTTNFVTINWTAPSAASGSIRGYVVYGRNTGDEAYLTRVPPETTSWSDFGISSPSFVQFPPTSNTTTGPIAKYQIPHQQRLILANISGNPCRVIGSGGGTTNVDKFHYSKGGFYVDVNVNAGEVITGIISQETRIVVLMTRSIHQIVLTVNETLGIVEPVVSRISGALGAVGHRAVQTSENEIAFVGRRAGGSYSLNFLGYEPNFTASTLRTSEISPRIRSWFMTLTPSRMVTDFWAKYFANAYFMFGPIGANEWQVMVYDRERLAFYGPWTITNATIGEIYYDTSEGEHFLIGKTTGSVVEMSDSYDSDSGTDFSVSFLTKKEDWKAAFQLKFLKNVFFAIRNPRGDITVTVYIESKDGTTTAARNFELSTQGRITPAGWGSFAWGYKAWGGKQQASTTSTSILDIKKYLSLNKPNILTAQVGITGTGVDFQLLAIKMQAVYQSESNIPSSFRSNS